MHRMHNIHTQITAHLICHVKLYKKEGGQSVDCEKMTNGIPPHKNGRLVNTKKKGSRAYHSQLPWFCITLFKRYQIYIFKKRIINNRQNK